MNAGPDNFRPVGRLRFVGVPAPIAVVFDNGPCFHGSVFAEASTGDDPLLRKQSHVGGSPRVIDDDQLAIVLARRARGESPTRIAAALGVSRATVYRYLAAAGA